MTVKKGNTVQIEYEGRLEDGTIFDSSTKYGQPLEFEVGSGQVIRGFDEGVQGMKLGEEKKIVISPAQGYGDYNPNLLKKVSRDKLPKGQEPKAGMMLALGTPDGHRFPAKIVEVHKDEVVVDVNHPLAGKTLTFKVKVVGVK